MKILAYKIFDEFHLAGKKDKHPDGHLELSTKCDRYWILQSPSFVIRLDSPKLCKKCFSFEEKMRLAVSHTKD